MNNIHKQQQQQKLQTKVNINAIFKKTTKIKLLQSAINQPPHPQKNPSKAVPFRLLKTDRIELIQEEIRDKIWKKRYMK